MAYISLKRRGDLVMYSQILGHDDYLKRGVMFAMHFSIMSGILKYEDSMFEGMKGILYAGWNSGGAGLLQFKKKTLFKPVDLSCK